MEMDGGRPVIGDGTLDPSDWPRLRHQAHRMLDDILDYVENVRDLPVWQPMPQNVREQFRQELPEAPTDIAVVHDEFLRYIMPYATGNVHPGFMGWVHGGGSVAGMLGDMLAAGLNANLGGRDHAPIEVERQILHWVRELFGYPEGASGLFVTGTSMANFICILVARTAALGPEVRRDGVAATPTHLVAYTSAAAHGCVTQAMDLSGLGTKSLRIIPTNPNYQMDLGALREAIRADRAAGMVPFLVVGTAGSVDTGAIDDLDGIADIARDEKLWFHIDGAYGALAILSPTLAPRLHGIERSDSLAFDFHKWGQVQYDAGFVLVKDGNMHRRTFASPAAYLRRETRGLAAGSPWPCDFGPDLSRGFRALKAWFTLKVYGTEQIGAVIARTCELAQYLKKQIERSPALELMAPVQLNIVCFRHHGDDALNAHIVAELNEAGIAAPSMTTIKGRLVIRAAFVNHRTQTSDIDKLIAATLVYGALKEAS
ncbi:MAG: cytochrome D ubiquinol oxidase subunit I [Alphaproteobacteria bacterium]|nr:cytochrome D ubiquinol oxidase subunit I [Alphaproteobacteria bacterium]